MIRIIEYGGVFAKLTLSSVYAVYFLEGERPPLTSPAYCQWGIPGEIREHLY